MELFLYWLLRASVLMALFYGLYKFFFANNTFHNVNRCSLIFILLVISVLPLFRFNFIPEKKTEPVTGTFSMDLSSIPVTEFVETQPRVEIPWMHILIILFAIGFLFTFIRYLIGLSQIAVIIRNSEKQMLPDHTVLCVTDKNISPFSWMKYIVLSRRELSADNQAVIRHERAHIHLRHSVDMIFFDLFTCIFWFNPFSWLLRREIQSVHEYQADEKVLSQGIDSKQYQLLLIRKSVGEYKFALANNFRQRDLHKRITMMKKNKTNRHVKWNYTMVFPVLFLAMIALSVPKLNAKAIEDIPETKEYFQNRKANIFIGTSDSAKSEGGKIMGSELIDLISGKNENLKMKLGEGNNPLVIYNGKEISLAELSRLSAQDIAHYQLFWSRTATERYGDKGKDGAVIITKKLTVPEKTKNVPKDSTLTGSKRNIKFAINGLEDINKPLIIVDGKKVSSVELQELNPEDIEAISILKGKTGIDIYGDEGKDGVVLITTKNAIKEGPSIRYKADSLIISSLNNKAETIPTMSISTESNPSLTYKRSNNPNLKEFLNNEVIFRVENPDGTSPLIILDGEKMPKDFELNSIDVKEIESMSVLKDKNATEIYGDEGKNGVIIITKKIPDQNP
ncbi:M56 family metallopeptidase [Proteiniphilum acetatigenes]|uniref:M56 family metallopeptidase n=1 Tax=Proteiniphilum acetatigenes TaxID=294710 RepID=UPI00037564C2|nr:M56 family metallopeptidase [Proteiniphilum acetatigenes]